MQRSLIQRRGEAQDFVFGDRAEAHHIGQNRCATGDGARLVQDQNLSAGQRLQGTPPFDDHAAAGGAGDTRHEGHGSGENQGAGRCDHEHRQRAHRIAGDPPGQRGHDQGEGQEDKGIPIRQANQGRPGGLSLLDQTDDPGIGALGRGGGGPELEGSPGGVHRAAANLLSVPALYRLSFARQCRFVQNRRSHVHPPVHRDNLACAYQEEVTGTYLRNITLRKIVPFVPVHLSRTAIQQCPQLAAGPPFGKFFQSLAPGEHQSDHGAGQVFFQRQRSPHGEKSDDVHSGSARENLPDHREGQRHERRQRGGRPDAGRRRRPSRQPEQDPCADPEECQ